MSKLSAAAHFTGEVVPEKRVARFRQLRRMGLTRARGLGHAFPTGALFQRASTGAWMLGCRYGCGCFIRIAIDVEGERPIDGDALTRECRGPQLVAKTRQSRRPKRHHTALEYFPAYAAELRRRAAKRAAKLNHDVSPRAQAWAPLDTPEPQRIKLWSRCRLCGAAASVDTSNPNPSAALDGPALYDYCRQYAGANESGRPKAPVPADPAAEDSAGAAIA